MRKYEKITGGNCWCMHQCICHCCWLLVLKLSFFLQFISVVCCYQKIPYWMLIPPNKQFHLQIFYITSSASLYHYSSSCKSAWTTIWPGFYFTWLRLPHCIIPVHHASPLGLPFDLDSVHVQTSDWGSAGRRPIYLRRLWVHHHYHLCCHHVVLTTIVTCNKYSDKFVFCYIFHTKPYFFKATQCCQFCFDFHEINSKQGRITRRFNVYWLTIFT